MDWIIFYPLFVMGAIIGSFLNVVIYRLPRNESIIHPRSHCPQCKAPIQWYRNIPIVSYLIQRGKCAECKSQISWQYPIVELITGLIWGWSFSTLDPQLALFFSILGSVLLIIAWIDGQHMLIPLVLSVTALTIVILAIGLNIVSWRNALLGVLVGVCIPAIVMGVMYLSTKRIGMGFGDLQLGLILGLWLGPFKMVAALLLASLLVIIVWAGISLRSGWDRNRPLPFAPYLIVSSCLVYITGYYQSDFIAGILLT